MATGYLGLITAILTSMLIAPEERSSSWGSLADFRRDLHAHPELRFEEHRTASKILAELECCAVSAIHRIGATGVFARLDGPKPGPLVLVRADIDAYPVADEKQVEYRSQHDGVTHACGHDVHTTVGLGVIRHFSQSPPEAGTVAVLFQPAEEIPFGAASGAAAMLSDPVIKHLAPTAVLGLHCWPQLQAGQVGVDREIAMAAKDAFEVIVRGASAHVATPANGRDAIAAAAQMVTALHAAVARRHDPHETVAFNVGTIEGGRSQSSLAAAVRLTGTLRTVEDQVRHRLRGVIEQVIGGTAAQFDLEASLVWANEMPVVRNSPYLVGLAEHSLPSVVTVVAIEDPPMTTDDFALYGSLAPSLYLKLGVASRDGAMSAPPLHSSRFDVDERCIQVGVDSLTSLICALLAQ